MQEAIGRQVLLLDGELGGNFRRIGARDHDAEKARQFTDADLVETLDAGHWIFPGAIRACVGAPQVPVRRCSVMRCARAGCSRSFGWQGYPGMPSKKSTTPVSSEYSAPTTVS